MCESTSTIKLGKYIYNISVQKNSEDKIVRIIGKKKGNKTNVYQ